MLRNMLRNMPRTMLRVGLRIRLNRRSLAVLGVSLALLSCAAHGQETPPKASSAHPILAIGSPAPDFSLPGVDGKVHKLADYKDSPYLMVMFICNHCPTSQLYEGRIKKLVEDYRDKGVGFVAIEPNDPKAILLSELGYTDVTDDMEGMKIRADYRHFNFPYLYDGDTQSVTQAYGAQATPHVFLFDRQRTLRYEGRIDDAQRESLVKKRDVRAALDALLSGKPVEVAHTPSFGCSTKWKSKIDSQLAEMKKIEAEPVSVTPVTADDLKKLRANAGGKVLLVSFWATWCGPCVTEFPALETTYRMFRRRDFDFVTVSTNYPDEKAGVMKILQEQHASGRNLQFASTDTYDLQAAFDAHWDAGVPFTMVIAPGGRVIYQEQGEVNILELRRAILANLENETYAGHPAYWAAK
jgi:peroxiredoxin